MTQLFALKSWYSAEQGRIITLEDDVLSIVSRIRELSDGRIVVQLDPQTSWFHLVEHCEDGTDRLVFSIEELDQRVLDRLMQADSHGRTHLDPYDAAEREADALDQAKEDAHRETIREVGEEILFGLQKDGRAPRMPAKVYLPRGVDAEQ